MDRATTPTDEGGALTVVNLLVVHAFATAGLLAALWLIIFLQGARDVLERWVAVLPPAQSTRVDRRQPLHSATWFESA